MPDFIDDIDDEYFDGKTGFSPSAANFRGSPGLR